MRTLLSLCVGASLVHLVVPQVSYLSVLVQLQLPQKNKWALISVACNFTSLASTYKEMDDPMSSFQFTDAVSIFLSKDRKPGNKNAKVTPTDFKKPNDAKTQLNSFVASKTSGKIIDLFSEFANSTDAVLVSCADKWELPNNEGKGYPVLLKGEYNVMVDQTLGFKMMEITKNLYISALIILPDGGKETAVLDAINDANLSMWRKSLTPQKVYMMLPRITLYVCSELTAEVTRLGGYETRSNKVDAKMILTYY